jgi:hypothetical protein
MGRAAIGVQLLNWTERLIRTRNECPEFGSGELRFLKLKLKTDNPAVLAHTCSWRANTVESPTPAEQLDIVDLDGYDYRWMRLR